LPLCFLHVCSVRYTQTRVAYASAPIKVRRLRPRSIRPFSQAESPCPVCQGFPFNLSVLSQGLPCVHPFDVSMCFLLLECPQSSSYDLRYFQMLPFFHGISHTQYAMQGCSAAHLNGRTGSVIDLCDNGRVRVLLLGTAEKKSVRHGNLVRFGISHAFAARTWC